MKFQFPKIKKRRPRLEAASYDLAVSNRDSHYIFISFRRIYLPNR